MRKSELFDKCVHHIEQLLRQRRLYIRNPYRCQAQHYFAAGLPVYSAIALSTVEGEAGVITRAWGMVFVDPDKPLRCTDVHNSFYGESVALGKLLRELDAIGLKT